MSLYYTTNTDKNFFRKNQKETNCGSFALNIEEWYQPDDSMDEDNDEFASYLWETGDYTLDEILIELLDRCVEGIDRDFGDEITFIDSPSQYKEKENEELIAFRVGLYDNDSFYISTDFHFRVFRNGRWQEKCGRGPIETDIELEADDPWELYNWIYNSPIVYFIHRLE